MAVLGSGLPSTAELRWAAALTGYSVTVDPA